MSSSIVLLSSGLDSTVNLARALRDDEVKLVLTFNYGQRAAESELRQSQKICEHFKVSHKIIDLPWLREITRTSLVNRDQEVPVRSQVAMDDYNQSLATANAVWVPNRNGVMLNIAASFAESLGAGHVVPGFNIEEATTFPDNTQDFLNALDVSFKFSTSGKVKAKCYTTGLDKKQIVALGRELRAPFELMWPCYFSGEQICGQCESCQRFLRATS